MSKKKYSFRQLLRLLRPYQGILGLAMLGLVGGSAINLILPQILRHIINDGYQEYLVERRWQTAAFVVGLFAVQGFCFFTRTFLFGVVAQRVVHQLRANLYEALLKQSISFFDSQRTGELLSRLGSDTQFVQDAISTKLSVSIRYTLQIVVGIVLMAWISLRLTFALLCILPIVIGLSIVLGKRLKRLSATMQDFLARATTIAEENFGEIRVVKAFGQEDRQVHRYGESIRLVLGAGIDRTKLAAFFASFVSFLMNACIFCVLLYGVSLVETSGLSYGDLSAFLLYGLIVAVSFSFVASAYTEFLQALGAIERVLALIEESHSRSQVDHSYTPLPSNWDGRIEFSSVSFEYPMRPDYHALNSVSFVAEGGKTTALVGPSGAGKSTIVNLILGFYSPSAGSILIDGETALNNVDPKARHAKIAFVPQEPSLFALSIEENLRFGAPEASRDQLVEVCKKARIFDFIDSLPNKFETLCGERGVQLSGGQKQRLAIARALLVNPILLILDEATSALDSENESLVQESLKEFSQQGTVIVIAHRLSTIKNAHQVIVLDQGKLVQSGNHQTLQEAPGLYQQLVLRQALA
ncbi:MAG: ABC transporter ATP-binding protein [Bdellovibrionales bacterium]|nr:ABC transporter ATP-binding protein [Bdellovibrionales bacterium]